MLPKCSLNCWDLIPAGPLIKAGWTAGRLPATMTDKQRDQRAGNISLVAREAQDNELQEIFKQSLLPRRCTKTHSGCEKVRVHFQARGLLIFP